MENRISGNAETNRITNLLDKEFVFKFLSKRVLPHYPAFKSIKKIKIQPVKKYIWQTTYHVVISYEVTFKDQKNKLKTLPIFCSAHSSEPRKCVHDILKYLWQNNFSKGFLTVPHPLFYSNYYKAVFYRGVNGRHLLYYIKQKENAEIEKIVKKTAAWLAKLHSIPTRGIRRFNVKTNRIDTVIPGKKRALEEVFNKSFEHLEEVKTIYETLSDREKKFFSSTSRRWLVHGDAHPENVIKVGREKIAMIDFTDFCLSDHARDVGSFLQQLEYMCKGKHGDLEFTEKIKDIFLKNYLKCVNMGLSDSLKYRIDTYYNWTAFRTALFFLLKHEPDPRRSEDLFRQIKANLDLY